MNIFSGLFTDTIFYKKLFKLGFPITLQAFLVSLVGVCDAFMLGGIDQNAMAAVSLATQIQFLQSMVVFAITYAVSILGAQYWGKNDKESISKIFRIGLRSIGSTSLFVALLCTFCPEMLMRIFAEEGPMVKIGAEYLRIAGFSYLLTGVSQCYLTILKITNKANLSAIIGGGAVILNIILNYIFIYGHFGFPAMGAKGAALATLIARIIELLAGILSSFQKGAIKAQWKRLFEKYPALSKDFQKCVLPLLGGVIFWGVGFSSYTAVLGHLGEDAAAANAAAAVLRDLLCCLTDGMAGATIIIVGNELGAGKLELGKLYGCRFAILSAIVGVITMGAVLLLAPVVINNMKLTAEASELLRGMFYILSFYMIGRCINTVVINGVFGAGGDTLFDMYSLAVCMWGLAVPLAFLGAFVFHWPILLVYGCTCIDEVGKLPWVFNHFRRFIWVKDLTRNNVDN